MKNQELLKAIETIDNCCGIDSGIEWAWCVIKNHFKEINKISCEIKANNKHARLANSNLNTETISGNPF